MGLETKIVYAFKSKLTSLVFREGICQAKFEQLQEKKISNNAALKLAKVQ